MENHYTKYRKSVYASINGTKGNLTKLSKSKLLSKEEKTSCLEAIQAMENLRVVFYNNRGQNDSKSS